MYVRGHNLPLDVIYAVIIFLNNGASLQQLFSNKVFVTIVFRCQLCYRRLRPGLVTQCMDK